MKKKIFALIVTICMLTTMFPVIGYADETTDQTPYIKSNFENDSITLEEGESIDLSGAFEITDENDEFQLFYVNSDGSEQRVTANDHAYGSPDAYDLKDNVLTVKNSNTPVHLNFYYTDESGKSRSLDFVINEKDASNFYFSVDYQSKVFKDAKITAILKDTEDSETGTELATSNGRIIIPKEKFTSGKVLELQIELPEGYQYGGQSGTISLKYSTDELLNGTDKSDISIDVENPGENGELWIDTDYMSLDEDGAIILNAGDTLDLSGAFEIKGANDEIQMIYSDSNGENRVISEPTYEYWIDLDTEWFNIKDNILTVKQGGGEKWLYFKDAHGLTAYLLIRSTSHKYGDWIIDEEPTCMTPGRKHRDCSECGYSETRSIRPADKKHAYKETVTPATSTKNGTVVYKCSDCGDEKEETIYSPTKVTLSKTSYTYNGKVQKPSVTIKDSNGHTLKSGTDYKLTYSSGLKKVGQYTVAIKYAGNYSGTANKIYSIIPKGTSISGLKAASKKFTVKWKKQATETTGYQIQYSTSSKFSGRTTKLITIKSNKTTSKAISKLSAKKKYYVRIRTYKTVKVNGKSTKKYSAWSSSKSVKTK